jgi:hypothetical protein
VNVWVLSAGDALIPILSNRIASPLLMFAGIASDSNKALAIRPAMKDAIPILLAGRRVNVPEIYDMMISCATVPGLVLSPEPWGYQVPVAGIRRRR